MQKSECSTGSIVIHERSAAQLPSASSLSGTSHRVRQNTTCNRHNKFKSVFPRTKTIHLSVFQLGWEKGRVQKKLGPI